MKELTLECPHCGRTIYISITNAGDLVLRHFDISTDSETIEFIKDVGLEFGDTNRKEV